MLTQWDDPSARARGPIIEAQSFSELEQMLEEHDHRQL
jgi:hypothetical protein